MTYQWHVVSDAWNAWNGAAVLFGVLMVYAVLRLWRGMKLDAFERSIRTLRQRADTTIQFGHLSRRDRRNRDQRNQDLNATPPRLGLLQISLMPMMLASCGLAMLLAQASQPDELSRPITWLLFVTVGAWYGTSAWTARTGIGPLRGFAFNGAFSATCISAALWGFYMIVDAAHGNGQFTRLTASVPVLLWWIAVGALYGVVLGSFRSNRIYRRTSTEVREPIAAHRTNLANAPARTSPPQWKMLAVGCAASLLFHLSAAPKLYQAIDIHFRYWHWGHHWRPVPSPALTLTMAPVNSPAIIKESILYEMSWRTRETLDLIPPDSSRKAMETSATAYDGPAPVAPAPNLKPTMYASRDITAGQRLTSASVITIPSTGQQADKLRADLDKSGFYIGANLKVGEVINSVLVFESSVIADSMDLSTIVADEIGIDVPREGLMEKKWNISSAMSPDGKPINPGVRETFAAVAGEIVEIDEAPSKAAQTTLWNEILATYDAQLKQPPPDAQPAPRKVQAAQVKNSPQRPPAPEGQNAPLNISNAPTSKPFMIAQLDDGTSVKGIFKKRLVDQLILTTDGGDAAIPLGRIESLMTTSDLPSAKVYTTKSTSGPQVNSPAIVSGAPVRQSPSRADSSGDEFDATNAPIRSYSSTPQPSGSQDEAQSPQPQLRGANRLLPLVDSTSDIVTDRSEDMITSYDRVPLQSDELGKGEILRVPMQRPAMGGIASDSRTIDPIVQDLAPPPSPQLATEQAQVRDQISVGEQTLSEVEPNTSVAIPANATKRIQVIDVRAEGKRWGLKKSDEVLEVDGKPVDVKPASSGAGFQEGVGGDTVICEMFFVEGEIVLAETNSVKLPPSGTIKIRRDGVIMTLSPKQRR